MTVLPFITKQALIIEPNHVLVRPYEYLAPTYEGHRYASISEAASYLWGIVPNLILLSASFPPMEIVEMLGLIKQHSTAAIIPVLFIVDLHHRTNFVPGVFWDESLAVLDSAVSEDVFILTISRITHWKPY